MEPDHLSNLNGRPDILFATVAIGGGHVATAHAMAEAIERQYPGRFELRVSDYMKDVGATFFDRRHKGFWRRALRSPLLARSGQRFIDSFPKATVSGQRILIRSFVRAAAKDLTERAPDLIVSNHGLVTSGLAEAKRISGLKVPVLTFATEPHDISAYWAEPHADHIVAPTEEVRRDLLRFGVPSDKLDVVGYPVRQAFLSPPRKEEARQRLGLQDRFTCLVSFGGEGLGRNQQPLIKTLLDSNVSPQVVVVTGRNEVLRKKLLKAYAGNDRLKVEGFVEDMASYLAAADVFVGKAGPASVYEALAVGRPVLLTGYTGLNERGVLRFVERERLGYYVKTSGTLLRMIQRYAEEPALSAEVVLRCRALGIEDATERMARYVARYASQCGM
ncbi:MAG: glycosyltransferase [Rubrobacteraceae bacterium]